MDRAANPSSAPQECTPTTGEGARHRRSPSDPTCPGRLRAPQSSLLEEPSMRTVIRGTGMHLPANVVDNRRLSLLMETSDEWIQKRSGIITRHYAARDEATSDLAVPAAERALSDAGIGPEEVDYVVFATMTPDYYFPGSRPLLQKKLRLGR